MSRVLVINAGSSSVKAAVFGDVELSGAVMEIGGAARLSIGGESGPVAAPDHVAALAVLLQALERQGVAVRSLTAAGHRVVHGGPVLTTPRRVDAAVLAEIEVCAPLAPLHNPHSLSAIRALAVLAPALPQVACFDTAFHASNPDVAVRFALPDVAATAGLRRYGFHGISYASLTEALPLVSCAPLPRRLLAFHLGNGASACAILEGRSVATTMGYSPLDGLTMGTRPGAIDPNAVLELADRLGVAGARDLLNRESGLRGLSGGVSDMRDLLASDSPQARFAVGHFCYWAVRHAGSLIAAMGGVDAVAFTGGIGEFAAPVRLGIMQGLAWAGVELDAQQNADHGPRLTAEASRIPAWIVPAAEERRIARETLAVLAAG